MEKTLAAILAILGLAGITATKMFANGPARQSRPQSAAPTRKDIPTIAKGANGSIVSIVMSDRDGKRIAQGSGFFVSKDGLIVTNYHVIAEGSSAVVKLPDGSFYAVDGVLAADKARDIAVIKAHGQNFRSLPLGNSDRIQVGEEVVAIGNPLSLESTVSNGIVSGVRAVKEDGGKYLQITAPISPGSSGGPLFNMAGGVIGITTMYLKGGENLNFAIPINDVKDLLANPSLPQSFPNEVSDEHSAEKSSPEAQINSPQLKYYQALLLEGKNTALVKGTYACFDDDPHDTFFRVISAHLVEGQEIFVAVVYFQNGVQSAQMPQGYLGKVDWNSNGMTLSRPGTWANPADQVIHSTDHLDWSPDQITIETAFGGPSDPMQSQGGYYAIRFVLQRSSLRFVQTFSPRGSVYDGRLNRRVMFSDSSAPIIGQCVRIPGARTPEESR